MGAIGILGSNIWQRRFRRSLKLYAVIAGIQFVCMASRSPLLAAEPSWRTYYSQGETALAQEKPAEAELCFRKALEAAQHSAASAEDTENCQMKLADTLALRNKTGEAQILYQQLLATEVKRYGNTKRIVPLLMALGSIQESLGDHTTAISYYQRALRINEKNYGPYSPQFAENLHVLGRANTKAGKRKEAAKQYKQAISILMKEPSLRASDQLQSVMRDYTDLINTDEDSDKSLIKDFQQDILRSSPSPANQKAPEQSDKHSSNASNSATPNSEDKSHGPSARARLSTNIPPSAFSSSIDKAPKAVSEQSSKGVSAMSMTKEGSSAVSSQTLRTGDRGDVTVTDSNIPPMRPAIRSENNIDRMALQPQTADSSWSAPTPGATSQAYQASTAGSSESAWHKQSLMQLNASKQSQVNEDPGVILRGIEQPWSDKTLSPAYKIVNDSIVGHGRYEQGADYYERMIAVDIDALGPHHPSVANDLNGLAQFYIHKQNYAQAEPLLARAYAIYREAYGMDNILTINACASYALVEFHLGKVDTAAELYRTALSHSESALGPNNLETARVLNELAYLYFHQGKLEEARTYYGWALSSTEAAVGLESPLLAACMKDYAMVLRSLGKSSEAAILETRANDILAAPNNAGS